MKNKKFLIVINALYVCFISSAARKGSLFDAKVPPPIAPQSQI